ncbi:MAG: response regulator [Methanobacteriota archaeon]|nr:MAG: response regulator [Euryarchaeota archaeon]
MKRIMVVDDEEDIRAIVSKMLEKEGYEVTAVESGQKCLDLLKAGERPDLILLDVMMPGMDGWETCRAIRDNRETKDLLVSMLTVRAEDEDKMKSMGYAAANWHISKPIEKHRFIKTVKWLLDE